MTPNEYQEAALSTLATENDEDTINMCLLGLIGETGEIADALKKQLYHRKGTDRELKQRIQDEAGDLLWYISVLAHTINKPLAAFRFQAKPKHSYSISNLVMCLSVSAGELAECSVDFPYPENVHTSFLLQDILEILLTLLDRFDIPLESVMQANIKKLAQRHKPHGESSGFQAVYHSDSGDSAPVPNDGGDYL